MLNPEYHTPGNDGEGPFVEELRPAELAFNAMLLDVRFEPVNRQGIYRRHIGTDLEDGTHVELIETIPAGSGPSSYQRYWVQTTYSYDNGITEKVSYKWHSARPATQIVEEKHLDMDGRPTDYPLIRTIFSPEDLGEINQHIKDLRKQLRVELYNPETVLKRFMELVIFNAAREPAVRELAAAYDRIENCDKVDLNRLKSQNRTVLNIIQQSYGLRVEHVERLLEYAHDINDGLIDAGI